MIRFWQIVVLGCAVVLLMGCNGKEQDKQIWEETKIGDIAPAQSGSRRENQSLKTINFDVYTFEMAAEKIGVLNNIQEMLSTEPLLFNNFNAFFSNFFSVGFGQLRTWNSIADLIRSAGGKRVMTSTLLIANGQTQSFDVARLDAEQAVFYFSAEHKTGGSVEGPGTVALRIKAAKIRGSRNVCKVSIQPVFTKPTTGLISQFSKRSRTEPFYFSFAAFGLKMSPGSFVLLGPREYINDQASLASFFFSRPGSAAVIRFYLIVCTRIVD